MSKRFELSDLPQPSYSEFNVEDYPVSINDEPTQTVSVPIPEQGSLQKVSSSSAVFEDEDPKTMREVGTLNTYGVIINAIVGTGFFSVPFTYYSSGILLAVIMTIVCGIFTVFGGAWSIENTARARGWYIAREKNIQHTAALNKYTFHQIEFSQMAQIFSGMPGFVFVQIIMGMYSLGSLWAYVYMFASTAANLLIRYAIHDEQECFIDNDPTSKCHTTYLLCCAFFLVCCLIMELFHMSKLAIVQSFFTVYRFVAFFLILVACIISLANQGSYWLHPEPYNADDANWMRFKWSGFPDLFSATSFALNCAYNLPSILTPMKRPKKHALHVAVGAMLTAAVVYILLSICLSFALGKDSQRFIILNFANFGSHGFQRLDSEEPIPSNWLSNLIKFVVMCFPVFNLLSSFPLVCGTIAYNFWNCVPQSVKKRTGRFGATLMKYILTIPAFALGAFIPSLGVIVKFCGLSAVFLTIFIPSFYQWYSKRKCGSEWRTPYSSWWSKDWIVFLALIFGTFALVFSVYQFVVDEMSG